MPKVRIDLQADFGPNKDKVVPAGHPVEPDFDAVLGAVKNKLNLKKKELAGIRLYMRDLTGVLAELPQGSCEHLLQNGYTVFVSSQDLLGGLASEATGSEEAAASGEHMLTKKMKTAQQSASELKWVPAGRGFIAARGCPNLETLAFLQQDRGMTGIVTLLRTDERNCAATQVEAACKRLKTPVRWLHAPLNGVVSLKLDELLAEDMESFTTIRQVCDWLQGPQEERIVVHCSAGLHRTGLYMYVLLRALGDSSEEAIAKICDSREMTSDEFIEKDFWSQAETIVNAITSTET